MTTHLYTVCEQRYDRYDGMPPEDTRSSGRIGCGTSRGGHIFRHDPLEEELDPCLSAAVRYNKQNSGFFRPKYFLYCIITLLAITLIAVSLWMIFRSSSTPGHRIITANQLGTPPPLEIEEAEEPAERAAPTQLPKPKPTEVKIPWDQIHLESGSKQEPKIRILIQEAHVRTGHPERPKPVATRPPPIPRLPPVLATRKIIQKPTTTTTRIVTTTTTTKAPTTTTKKQFVPKPLDGRVHDCDHYHKDGKKSGTKLLSVPDYADFYAYCEMESDHGWIVLQRRTSGKLPFWNATFDQYDTGFGDTNDDHWLGLERVHAFAELGHKLEMRIRLKGDFCQSRFCSGFGDSGMWWGDWEFTIGNRADGYRIKELHFLRGNLSNSDDREKDLFGSLCNNQKFTTVDVDNDDNREQNCAVHSERGAWWHRDCSFTALNGLYGVANKRPAGQFWMWKAQTENRTHWSYNIKPQQSLIMFRVGQQRQH